ncbi:hypothetical protein ACIA8O_36655 [Kitasatospora sp. NPDC051853]|uniref:hypothetical protein n=1 Tax=Kitasatospora sp. NPDC051853 TaxID=3364058 RepID=UPI0037B84669
MPFAETTLRDEYAAAVEHLSGRTLDAVRDGGGTAAFPDPADLDPTTHRALLAAARVLGVNLFAPQLLAGAAPDDATAALLAEARRALPEPAAATEGGTLVIAWQDWAAARVLAGTPHADDAPVPAPSPPPGPADVGWQSWSVRMAQLSGLALPGLDGAVHDLTRTHTLDLARGTVRAMLRRDPTTAVRLARWLAWAHADGRPVRLEIEPILDRIGFVGDGTNRSGLELAIARRLLNGEPR